MRKVAVFAGILFMLGIPASNASADTILFEWTFNVNGTVYDSFVPDTLPASFDTSGFDFTTGLGSIVVTLTSGSYFGAFFDHEIDETVNGFSNEFGATSGALPAGMSFEIDEPGYVFGDIWTNLGTGTLDDSIGVPAAAPDDVSMALGWNFLLAPGETATFVLNLTETAPAGGFFLQQSDPDTGANVFFAGGLTITGGGGQEGVPEPGTWILMLSGFGLAALAGRLRKRD
jgi:hypothetical protein